MAGDISTTIAQATNGSDLIGDWSWTLDGNGDLVDGSDIQTAVLICLFTDALADPDYELPPGATDRRGYWADFLRPAPLGSRLWQFTERGKKTPATLRLIERAATDSLKPMQDDGIIVARSAQAVFLNGAGIELTVSVQIPGGKWWSQTVDIPASR